MLGFILKRLLLAVPTLLVVATLTFFMMKAVPGGPFDQEKSLPPEIKANIDRKFGLDLPLWKQYANYMALAAQGDMGPSYSFMGGRTVREIIAESLPVSLQLGSCALIFALIVGLPLGVLSAYRQGSWLDASAMFLAMAGISLPPYLVASVFILVFSLWFDVLPSALWEGPSSVVLPALTLGMRPMALIARLVRTSLVESLMADYIRTAHAKGLPLSLVIFKHALRNSLIPLVTLLGPLTAAVVTGSFIVEVIFAIPGLGKYFVAAVIDRDYSLIMGVTLVYGMIVIFANLVVDILYGVIDPRIRFKEH